MALYLANLSDDFIRRIAGEYLCGFTTMEQLAKKHKTSPATISNILFKGVSQNILGDITAEAVANKAQSNTENIVRTRRRWQKALEIRAIPTVEEEIAYKAKKLEELEFQFETYDDYFVDEPDAPTKRSIWCAIGRLKGEIKQLENYIKNLNLRG